MFVPYTDINNLIGKWAINEPSIDNFTVNNVLNALGLDYDCYINVFKYLMSKDGFELVAKKVLMCPQNHTGNTYLFSEPIDEDEVYDCWCGEEYHFDPNHVIIAFSFKEEYITDLKKKVLQIA